MDVNIFNELLKKTGTEDIFVMKTNTDFDEMIVRDYNLIETAYDNDHTYLERVYNGSMHSNNSMIRFMKSLRVIVSQDKSIKYNPDMSKLYMKKVCLKKGTKYIPAIMADYESAVYHMFVNGDITPQQISDYRLYSDKVTIHYNIGEIRTLYTDSPADKDAYDYYICVPYQTELVTTNIKKVG